MRSPLSPRPSLARRRRPVPAHLLLGVPRVSPERELAVLRALMKPKPQFGESLLNQVNDGQQPWPPDFADRARSAVSVARESFGFPADLHLPPAGEFLALASFAPEHLPAANATALLLSAALPATWVVVGRLFVRDEAFFRRERGVKLTLRPANDVRLSREMRANYREAAKALAGG